MTKRIFSIDCGMDLSLKLEIDTEVMTPKFAADIARFWASSEDVLDASEGDDYQAIARWAAPILWSFLMDGYHEAGAVMTLHEREGWGIPGGSVGMKILDYDIPDMDPVSLEVVDIAS